MHACVCKYSTLQIQGIKRFAYQTRLNAALNAFTTNAKRVYSRRQTRLLETRFARLDWTRLESSRAKGVAHSRDVCVLEFCARRLSY